MLPENKSYMHVLRYMAPDTDRNVGELARYAILLVHAALRMLKAMNVRLTLPLHCSNSSTVAAL